MIWGCDLGRDLGWLQPELPLRACWRAQPLNHAPPSPQARARGEIGTNAVEGDGGEEGGGDGGLRVQVRGCLTACT